MAQLCGCDPQKYIRFEQLTQRPDTKILKHLLSTARLGLDYISDDPREERCREYLGYPLNLLYLASTGGLGRDFIPLWSPKNKVLSIIGRKYLSMNSLIDPVTKKLVNPAENIAQTLHILESGEETFNCVIFVAKEDEQNWPIRNGGNISWKFISTKFNGKGATFCDDPKIRLGVIMGENYFTKNGVSGVHETMGEESDPWHFFACEWSVWKEGLTWAKRGRHTRTHPCEQARLRSILKDKPIVLWDFEDLVNKWRECAGKMDQNNTPIFAYYSGELAFLVLAASKIGDTEYVHTNYDRYSQALQEFCTYARSQISDYKQTEKPETMVPLITSWLGLTHSQEMFALVRSRLDSFSESFLKENAI